MDGLKIKGLRGVVKNFHQIKNGFGSSFSLKLENEKLIEGNYPLPMYFTLVFEYSEKFSREIFIQTGTNDVIQRIYLVDYFSFLGKSKSNDKTIHLSFRESVRLFTTEESTIKGVDLNEENRFEVIYTPDNFIVGLAVSTIPFPQDDETDDCKKQKNGLTKKIPNMQTLKKICNEINNITCDQYDCSTDTSYISVYYKYDGCYGVAEQVRKVVGSYSSSDCTVKNYGDGYHCKKIFIKAQNSDTFAPYGWTNHIAVLVELTNGGKYVVDPILSDKPCLIKEWLDLMSLDKNYSYTLLDANQLNSSPKKVCNFGSAIKKYFALINYKTQLEFFFNK